MSDAVRQCNRNAPDGMGRTEKQPISSARTVVSAPSRGWIWTVPADEIGCFSVRPIPSGAFRLHCRTASDVDALTGWITLADQ